MNNSVIFAKALHNFTMDAACGDAIRHLTDKGFTLSQIKDTLTFPAPEAHIASVMYDRMVETRKIVTDVSVGTVLSDTFVEVQDRYGRKSFLKVKKESPEEEVSSEDYVRYNDMWVLKSAQEQVSSLSDHILPKDRNTGSHRDM